MADDQTSVSEQKKEDWMNSKWRPMMGWMYMLVCMMDFVGFPILWSLLQALHGGTVTSQWQPLTLQGAGLFHIAMGAVIGISAYGRTQEKLNGANNGGATPAALDPSNLAGFAAGSGTTYQPPVPAPVVVTPPPAPAPVAPAPAAPVTVTVDVTPAPAPVATTGFGGKPAPAPEPQPEQ